MNKKAKGKGRPRIPDTERASEWLPGIRLTIMELEQYRAAAQVAGLPLSQWARNALAATVQEPPIVARKPKESTKEWTEPPPEPPRRLRKALAVEAKE